MHVASSQLSFMNPASPDCSPSSVSYTEALAHIVAAVDEAKSLGLSVWLENIPLCLIPGYANIISDTKKPEENKEYYNVCKDKPAFCKTCVRYESCDGVWKGYLDKYGSGELVPILSSSHAAPPLISEDAAGLIDASREKFSMRFPMIKSDTLLKHHEMIGLALGLRKAAIFYSRKSFLDKMVNKIRQAGFNYLISDFAYAYTESKTYMADAADNGVSVSIYVSRDMSVCERLKKIDYIHQRHEARTSSIFFEIGEMLGYPKCCSQSLLDIEHDHEKNEKEGLGTLFDVETFYPMKAYMKQGKKDWRLNNMVTEFPGLVNFNVCSYSCQRAIDIADRIKQNIVENGTDVRMIRSALSAPLLFFSAEKMIFLIGLHEVDGAWHYDDCFMGDNNRFDMRGLKSIYVAMKQGDSFTMDDDMVRIRRKGAHIFSIHRNHPYDGRLIRWD